MQSRIRSLAITGLAMIGIGLTASALIPRVHADTWDKKTIVTVNESIIAGNKVLSPGTYVWKLLDSPGDRHVVQIFDKDQRHLETTVLAIPNYRLHPAGKTSFAFWETPAGVPKAVRAWFYPGDNFGQELPYPKKLVAQLASAAPVPVAENYREPESTPAPVPAPEPSASAPEPTPAAAPAPMAPVAAPAPEPPAAAASEPASLPHTATINPTIGLLGVASLGLAGLLTLATKKA